MKSPRLLALTAAGTLALSLGLTACGGDDEGGNGGGWNAAVNKVHNPSDKKGGVLRMAISSDIDSTDPGNMYYAWSTNFSRLYSRSLLTYPAKPGPEGGKPAPDLAESLGVPSDNNKTWTFKLKKGLKYEDGSEIKAQHIKYAVARTFDRGVLRNGPSYFSQLLDADGYKGPYKDKNLDNFKGVETPDDYTVVFKLKKPFPEFNELVNFSGQTAPVPPEKDTGERYGLRPFSSGPYKWEGNYQPGKGGTLVRNEYWDPNTDPHRKQLPDKIEVRAGLDAQELDNQLLSGQIHVDLAGSGVQDNARAQILQDEKLKNNADNPPGGFHWYIPINTKVIDNVECRRAIVWATNRDALWRAYGGDVGGELATSIMPPTVVGREKGTDHFTKAEKGYTGDVEQAKAALQRCGKPNGFETTMVYRSDRDKEKAVAEAMQQSLARVGIKLNLQGYPANTYTNDQFGSPSFNKKNNIGLGTYGWLADWPTGYGYLQAITDGDAIVESGNANPSELDDPQINKWWDEVMTIEDPAERAKIYNQIDDRARSEAAILPNVYARSLLYRPETLTNVFFHQGYGMYNYSTLGVTE
ncbi:ABC transporter substrate-binding protein [Thermomonospora catenispora]|uniref:ABC transporter substrate-binding protein n=1 Tax=Thermomonospora catenispora TaxID=2493090 RepID=UPI00111EDE7F|nr:ABC transporter substrate-binding protein [Thermomonospora catenispora]TNY37438.1 ABC transporter substrate-binding protein [Thermomonospora catenispora]